MSVPAYRRALVSVSDKSGLVEFLKPLYDQGLKIFSTGGTAEHLRKNGFAITDVSELTAFPEVMNGRVKTLHPKVHMGLLARYELPEDRQVLADFKTDLFDLVVVNLYPFRATLEKGATHAELIEKIDVGGPTMLRAAAKNYKNITVITDPADYHLGSWPADQSVRLRLAQKVFALTAEYDRLIAENISRLEGSQPKGVSAKQADFAPELAAQGRKILDLRYGENPQQAAAWFASSPVGLHSAEILQGKPLSYNNILDLQATLDLCQKLDRSAAVIVKHNNPCGVAEAKTLVEALTKAIQSDPVSCFGGIVALNQEVDAMTAQALSDVFFECILAPAFSQEALTLLGKKKNLRLLRLPNFQVIPEYEMKTVAGGFVVQRPDQHYGHSKDWKFLGDSLGSDSQIFSDLVFGEKVCGALKSNAIAIVKNAQTLGLGMGQVNRVDAVELAIQRWGKHQSEASSPVLISDAFFPFKDSIDRIAAAGIRWVLQPGGSLRDDEVIQAAKDHGINLVLSGARHFRH